MAKKNVTEVSETGTPPAEYLERALEIFKMYPMSSEIYFTSNGFTFWTMNDARNHAAGLKDKNIEKVRREECLPVV
jgi:hypothetical protein